MTNRLVLRIAKGGVKRWEKAEDVTAPTTDNAAHQKILAKHGEQYDWLASRARDRNDDLDEAAFAEGKATHLDIVHHMLQNGDEHLAKHLDRMKVMPWQGHNDTLYNTHHNTIHIGTETMAGGHKKYDTTIGHMVAHELAHAADMRHGHSEVGEEIAAKLSRSKDANLDWLPGRLRVAKHDHREWAPRLLELHLKDPAEFEKVAARLKKDHGIDAHALMKKVTGLHLGAAAKEPKVKPADKRQSKPNAASKGEKK
jgi:hypothetical protein